MTQEFEIICKKMPNVGQWVVVCRPPCMICTAKYIGDKWEVWDVGKWRFSLVPTQIIKDIAEVREYGVKKYGDSESWKEVEIVRYTDALGRHYLEMLKDPLSKDDESGIEHYKHMACNMAFICELLNVPF